MLWADYRRWRQGRPASGTGPLARGAHVGSIPSYDACWIINDAIEVRNGRIRLGQFPAADIWRPRDTIINKETLLPPGE